MEHYCQRVADSWGPHAKAKISRGLRWHDPARSNMPRRSGGRSSCRHRSAVDLPGIFVSGVPLHVFPCGDDCGSFELRGAMIWCPTVGVSPAPYARELREQRTGRTSVSEAHFMKDIRILVGCTLVSFLLLSASAWAQVVTEFSVGISPRAYPYGITAGPDGNLWFTEQFHRDRAHYPARRRHRVQHRHHRRLAALPASRPAPMATCGSRSIAATGSDGLPRWGRHRVQRRHQPGRHPLRHHRRPRWQPVVHGTSRQPDRADHPARRRHRVQHRHHRWRGTCGEITAGPDGNLWFTEYLGERIGRITPLGVVTEFSAAFPDGPWRHHRRSRRQPVVRRARRQPDRPHYPARRGHRVQRSASPLASQPLSASPPAPMATCGSPRNSATDRADYPARRRHRVQRRHHRRLASLTGITAGPDGNLWFTEYSGNRIGRITTGVATAQRTFVLEPGVDIDPCTLT